MTDLSSPDAQVVGSRKMAIPRHQFMRLTSPFQNGYDGRARRIQVTDLNPNPLLGEVYTAGEEAFRVAVPCEHWAPKGTCRHNCRKWRAAVAAQPKQED